MPIKLCEDQNVFIQNVI